MKKHFLTIRTWARAHRIVATIIILTLLYGGNWVFQGLTDTSGETRYVVARAATSTIIATVSGSGQVSTLDQIDIKSKASGDVISVLVSAGDTVKTGQVIARIDATDALKAVRDAEVSLETAKLSLQKTIAPPDELALMQAENSLTNALTSKQTAEYNLSKTYNDSFNAISNAFLDLPSIVSGLHDLLFTTSNQLGGNNVNNIDYYASTANLYDDHGKTYGDDTYDKYQIALAKYNKNFQDYKKLDRNTATGTIEATLIETYDTTLAISDAVKSANNLIQFYQDQMTQHSQKIPTLSNTQLSTLNSYTGTTNSHLNSLLSLQSTLQSNKNSLAQSITQINISTLSMAELKAGADALDIRNQEISVATRENTLLDARRALADYTVRAPFDGMIAKVNTRIGDTIGNGTAIATLVANQQVAQLSLNEIDAAKVKVGQKAMLSFDAIEGLSISGAVATIDTLGTVSQGVVTYAVQINFDTQDTRVKSGMSVNATIQTKVKTDVLTVPSAAIKTRSGAHYVEIFDTPIENAIGNQGTPSVIAPRGQGVEIGLADDTSTEIVSGLKAGDQVVTKTIAGTGTTQTTSSAPSILGGGTGGGTTRMMTGGGFR